MDKKAKTKYGVLCFVPGFSFLVTLVYYLYTLSPIMSKRAMYVHYAITTTTAHNYNTLFIMLAISAVLSAITMLYCIIHLARMVHMPAGMKARWIVLLAALVPVSFVIFYFFEIRKEPKYVETYPNMA